MADTTQAEFLYKVKPKLQNQFKAAEAGGVPFALILGEVSSFPPPDPLETASQLMLFLRMNLPRARRNSRRWVSQRTTR